MIFLERTLKCVLTCSKIGSIITLPRWLRGIKNQSGLNMGYMEYMICFGLFAFDLFNYCSVSDELEL